MYGTLTGALKKMQVLCLQQEGRGNSKEQMGKIGFISATSARMMWFIYNLRASTLNFSTQPHAASRSATTTASDEAYLSLEAHTIQRAPTTLSNSMSLRHCGQCS